MSSLLRVACCCLLIAALAVSGCATKKVAPPSEDLRSELQTLGLLTPDAKSPRSPDEPVKGTGSAALRGAGLGAAGTFLGIASAGCSVYDPSGLSCLVGIALGVVLAPVGAVVGAGVGAANSHSADEVEKAATTIAVIVEQARPNQDLLVQFARYATETYGTQFVSVSCQKPNGGCEADEEYPPRYALDLHYEDFVLVATGRIDPDLHVAATIKADIFRLTDRQSVYARSWEYQSPNASYFELAENDGALLKELIEERIRVHAAAVATDLLWTEKDPRTNSDTEDRLPTAAPTLPPAAGLSPATAGFAVAPLSGPSSPQPASSEVPAGPRLPPHIEAEPQRLAADLERYLKSTGIQMAFRKLFDVDGIWVEEAHGDDPQVRIDFRYTGEGTTEFVSRRFLVRPEGERLRFVRHLGMA